MTKELIVTQYIITTIRGLRLLLQNLTHYSDLYLSARGTGIALLFLLKPAALAKVGKTIFVHFLRNPTSTCTMENR